MHQLAGGGGLRPRRLIAALNHRAAVAVGRESEAHPAFSNGGKLKSCRNTYAPWFQEARFFTVTLLERRRKLLNEHFDNLRGSLMAARQRRPFTVEAIVILPDRRLEIE